MRYTTVREMLKVNESERLKYLKRRNGICDFCGVREARHSINGSLWFLCTRCMNNMYEEIPRTIKENLADLEEEE